MANNNFYKAIGRAAKVTGKNRNDLIKYFKTPVKDAPAELKSALITAHRIYDGYKTKKVAAVEPAVEA